MPWPLSATATHMGTTRSTEETHRAQGTSDEPSSQRAAFRGMRVAKLLDFQGAIQVWLFLCLHPQGYLVSTIKLRASRQIHLASGRHIPPPPPPTTNTAKVEAPLDLMLAAAVPSALRTFPEGHFLVFTHHSIPTLKTLVFRCFVAKEVSLTCFLSLPS